MTEQSTIEQWRMDIMRRTARVSRNAGRDYDAWAFLGLVDVLGEELVTVEAWRAAGGIASRSTLETIDPKRRLWFTGRPGSNTTEHVERLREQVVEQEARVAALTRCCDGCRAEAQDVDIPRLERLRTELAEAESKPAPAPEPEPEPDDDECEHVYIVSPWCRWCEGDPECEHDFGCTRCQRCEAEHNCQHCELDPACDHEWLQTCDECGTNVPYQRH